MGLNLLLAASVCWLNMADLLITRAAIRYGLAHEGNPVMAVVIHSDWAIIGKPLLAWLLCLYLVWEYQRGNERARTYLTVLAAWYVGVVTWGGLVLEMGA